MPFDAVAIAASAVGSGISAYSAISAGQAQNRLSQYNARLADEQANLIAKQGSDRAMAQMTQNEQILSRQRAAYAANGVVTDTGSPLLVEAKQAGYMQMAVLQDQAGAQIESQRYDQQAQLDRAQGSISSEAGFLNAGATILQGAGKAGSMFAQDKKLGLIS